MEQLLAAGEEVAVLDDLGAATAPPSTRRRPSTRGAWGAATSWPALPDSTRSTPASTSPRAATSENRSPIPDVLRQQRHRDARPCFEAPCGGAGVKEFVFSSTCATYGVPVQVRMDETHPQNPINPYGWSKLMVERMLAVSTRAYGLRHVSLRYFNAAGAHPDGTIGEDHDPETHLLPLVLGGGRTAPRLWVFGDDYPTPDGTCHPGLHPHPRPRRGPPARARSPAAWAHRISSTSATGPATGCWR